MMESKTATSPVYQRKNATIMRESFDLVKNFKKLGTKRESRREVGYLHYFNFLLSDWLSKTTLMGGS